MVKRTEEQMRAEQDKKNYQDFVYQTNQALQNLAVAMKDLKDEFAKHIADVGSKLVSKDSYIGEIEDKHDQDYKLLVKTLENQHDSFNTTVDTISKHVTKSYRNFLDISYKDKIVDLERSIVMLMNEDNRIEFCIDSSNNRLSQAFDAKLKALKHEILSIPSESQALSAKVNEQFDIMRVDFAGLVQEIELLKHSLFVNQKYIESVHTLLKQVGVCLKQES